MYFRSYRIYGLSSTREILNPKHTDPVKIFTTGTTKQPKLSKTHRTASQKAGTANMSQTPTPCRTMPPSKTKTKTSHSTRRPASGIHQFFSHLPYMHVHQQQSQTCKLGEPLALREVKHPHKGRTSVSRFPLAKQGISSQDSGCFEGIGRFPRDPCKLYLKSGLQPAIHASQKQEKPLIHLIQDHSTHTISATTRDA